MGSERCVHRDSCTFYEEEREGGGRSQPELEVRYLHELGKDRANEIARELVLSYEVHRRLNDEDRCQLLRLIDEVVAVAQAGEVVGGEL